MGRLYIVSRKLTSSALRLIFYISRLTRLQKNKKKKFKLHDLSPIRILGLIYIKNFYRLSSHVYCIIKKEEGNYIVIWVRYENSNNAFILLKLLFCILFIVH